MGAKIFWTALNNQLVIDAINKISSRIKAPSISTFEFSSSYTFSRVFFSILFLRELINFSSKGDLGNYIVAIKFGARWFDNNKNYKIIFNKAKLKLATNYLLDYFYFTVGNSTPGK